MLASGHVFCQYCCKKIIEETSLRLSPACPLCREPFQSDSIRLIRIDCPPSRWTTPKFKALAPDIPDDNGASHNDDKPSNRSRDETRRLEDKVAKVALKKCSVEEVFTLYNELTRWLMSDVKHDNQVHLFFRIFFHFSHPTSSSPRCPSVLRCCEPSLQITSPIRKPSKQPKTSNSNSNPGWVMPR